MLTRLQIKTEIESLWAEGAFTSKTTITIAECNRWIEIVQQLFYSYLEANEIWAKFNSSTDQEYDWPDDCRKIILLEYYSTRWQALDPMGYAKFRNRIPTSGTPKVYCLHNNKILVDPADGEAHTDYFRITYIQKASPMTSFTSPTSSGDNSNLPFNGEYKYEDYVDGIIYGVLVKLAQKTKDERVKEFKAEYFRLREEAKRKFMVKHRDKPPRMKEQEEEEIEEKAHPTLGAHFPKGN